MSTKVDQIANQSVKLEKTLGDTHLSKSLHLPFLLSRRRFEASHRLFAYSEVHGRLSNQLAIADSIKN